MPPLISALQPYLLQWLGVPLAIAFVWAGLILRLGGRRFAPDRTIRIAGSERNLARARPLELRALPGGEPGLFRGPARICLTEAGDGVLSARRAVVVIEPGDGDWVRVRGAPLERAQPGGAWSAVSAPELADGPARGAHYRVRGLYLRLD